MMTEISISTGEKREVIDITDRVSEALGGIADRNGACSLFLMHTTAALTIAELETGNGDDLLAATKEIVPKLKYFHSDDIEHSGAHIMSALVGASVNIPVRDGKPVLGTWQRIVLVEFDGPKQRKINITFITNG